MLVEFAYERQKNDGDRIIVLHVNANDIMPNTSV